MTGASIVELDAHRPHQRVSVECAHCGHGWIAVFPVACKSLECPQCHLMLWLLPVPA